MRIQFNSRRSVREPHSEWLANDVDAVLKIDNLIYGVMMKKCLILTCLLIATAATAAERPNIVVLFSDDAGYADFGFQPNVRDDMKKLTPHIDSIARDGARFTNAYMSSAVCSPSRAGLMTGRYQHRFGHDNNLPPGTKNGLPLDETFGAKRLQKLGYTTGLVGKWHLGYPAAFHPTRRGFDWFYGLLQGSRPYYTGRKVSRARAIRASGNIRGKASGNRASREIGDQRQESGYVTDMFGDAACRFIAEQKGEPFFLFVSFTAPHGPLEPRKSDAERVAQIKGDKGRQYAGLVVALDDNVGKILAALKKAGVEKNTLVVFTNDNGGTKDVRNVPLKGLKGSLWEGGVRVPWAMRWPGRIKPGSVIDDPVIALDLVPTFISAARGKIDPAWNLDGIDLSKRLTSEQASLPKRTLFWRQHGATGSIALREGNWKLIHRRRESDSRPELYDLSADISETTNLAGKHPALVKSLSAKLAAWEKQLATPLWGPGKRNQRGASAE